MSDEIANFSLRDASKDQLGIALGRCYAEYNAWHGQASFIADFANHARVAGVEVVVAERIREWLDLGEEMGVVIPTAARTTTNPEIADQVAKHQLITADVGGSIAAIVMVHSACERFLWRLVRFGLVDNRKQAVTWVASRKVSIDVVSSQDRDSLIDAQIEEWWDELERVSLLRRWDILVGLVGYPKKLHDNAWHFDKDMLARFDEVRHNAVHNDGRAVRCFDLAEFMRQLARAQTVWLVHIAMRLDVQIPGEILFPGTRWNTPKTGDSSTSEER